MMPCKLGDGDCQEKENGDCTGIVTGHGTGGRSLYRGFSGLTGTAGWVTHTADAERDGCGTGGRRVSAGIAEGCGGR